jgi:hypothetical protein
MTNYTDLEKKVFNAIIDLCMDACEADCKDIVDYIGVDIKSVKGVVGSLVKKGLVQVGSEYRGGNNFMTIHPLIDGDLLSFGCDLYDDDEIEEYKI